MTQPIPEPKTAEELQDKVVPANINKDKLDKAIKKKNKAIEHQTVVQK
jgi:hypothetical protein